RGAGTACAWSHRRRVWAAFFLSPCTETLRVPTCLLSSPLVLCSLSEHVAPPLAVRGGRLPRKV
uniref:Uncharacterized protein n=1 Tax=Mus spicilegus TaxID=10103 RepID=A0A8C6HIX0_MUSSI